MVDRRVGVVGARSLVGECLLPHLVSHGWRVTALTRKGGGENPMENPASIEWRRWKPGMNPPAELPTGIRHWVFLAPIWALPAYFPMLIANRAKRVVALSSTSRYTKQESSDPSEQALARRLADSEQRLIEWAEASGVEWVILRPTLIYGLGRDRNIGEIARFIRRFGFFPVFGAAQGLRQPVHAADVAAACAAALAGAGVANRAYTLSGCEILPYRKMVGRVFSALGKPERFITIPLGVFRVAIACLRALPRFRHWSVAMAERMNRDLVFAHNDAARDLGFCPRSFRLSQADL